MKAISIVSLLSIVLIASSVMAQDEPRTRSIKSDDFSKKRPIKEGGGRVAATSSSANRVAAKKTTEYKYVPKNTNTIKWASGNSKRPQKNTKAPAQTFDIGVTIWKLRPATPGDAGAKLPVAVDGGQTEEWTPVRVSTKSVFRPGDRLRFAVESARAGRIYLINSEIHSDGTYGRPHLLFPYPANAYNGVGPGVPVEVPDQTDETPSFKIQPKSAKYAGELILVVIAPTPLKFVTAADGTITNLENVLDLDSLVNFEIYEREDNADSIYTKAEAEAAACGTATRELVRVKSTSRTDPCGTKTRQLTRDDPRPQAIYRAKAPAGRPAVALVRLSVQN